MIIIAEKECGTYVQGEILTIDVSSLCETILFAKFWANLLPYFNDLMLENIWLS